VLVRTSPDPVTGHFFQLRDLPDARVYLGCMSDAGGNVREWIELWVQTIEGLDAGLLAHRETLSNHLLDRRWTTQCKAIRAWTPESVIETHWEKQHPLPTVIDLSKQRVCRPTAPRWSVISTSPPPAKPRGSYR
jgi:hypothetical protein